MKYLKLICSTYLLLFSCSQVSTTEKKEDPPTLTETQIDSVLDTYNFSLANPVVIDSSDYIIFPMGAYGERNKSSRNVLDLSKSDSYSQPYGGHWNMLFFHIPTRETHLLSESKLLISAYKMDFPYLSPILSQSILYHGHNTDFNRDGKLDAQDPLYLFLSTKGGKNFKRISPKSESLVGYERLNDSDQLLIQTRRDQNGDQLFDREDELVWYFMDLGTDEIPHPILDAQGRKMVEDKFFEQWLKSTQ